MPAFLPQPEQMSVAELEIYFPKSTRTSGQQYLIDEIRRVEAEEAAKLKGNAAKQNAKAKAAAAVRAAEVEILRQQLAKGEASYTDLTPKQRKALGLDTHPRKRAQRLARQAGAQVAPVKQRRGLVDFSKRGTAEASKKGLWAKRKAEGKKK